MKKTFSRLRGKRSTAIPPITWDELKALVSSLWQRLCAEIKTSLPKEKPGPAKENTPQAIQPAQPYNPALLFYFVDRGRRSYEKGISFAQWSDRMIIIHGNSVMPYLHEAWQYVKEQTFRINGKQTMKTRLIITALAAFILTGLFPPWLYTIDKDSVNGFKQGFGFVPPSQGVHSRRPAGYSLLFTPPANPDGSAGNGVQIDFGRLVLEWAVLAAITGVVWILVVKPTWSRGDKSNRSQKFISPPANPGN